MLFLLWEKYTYIVGKSITSLNIYWGQIEYELRVVRGTFEGETMWGIKRLNVFDGTWVDGGSSLEYTRMRWQ